MCCVFVDDTSIEISTSGEIAPEVRVKAIVLSPLLLASRTAAKQFFDVQLFRVFAITGVANEAFPDKRDNAK